MRRDKLTRARRERTTEFVVGHTEGGWEIRTDSLPFDPEPPEHLDLELALLNAGLVRVTNEAWWSTYPGGVVQVQIVDLILGGRWRVLVRGTDDFGLERDCPSRDAAERLLERVPMVVNRRDLWELGFRPS